jgi:hypothetical protein
MMEALRCAIEKEIALRETTEPWCEGAFVVGTEAQTEIVNGYFLQLCERVASNSEDGAAMIAEGIWSVWRGERESFDFKYSKQTPSKERGFEGNAHRIRHEGVTGVLVTYCPISVRAGKEHHRDLLFSTSTSTFPPTPTSG